MSFFSNIVQKNTMLTLALYHWCRCLYGICSKYRATFGTGTAGNAFCCATFRPWISVNQFWNNRG